jgi:hypothetical protein
LIAAIFAAFLASLPVDVFYDRENYLVYADSSVLILVGNFGKGILSILANEPLWLLINITLKLFLSAENVVRSIVFFSAFASCYKLLTYDIRYIVLILLFITLPQFLKNNIVHLRQGLAISVFLIGFLSNNKTRNMVLIGLTPFIHASFFFIVFFLVLEKWFRYFRLAWDLRSLSILAFGVFTSLFGLYAASLLGARQGDQADYLDFEGVGVGLGLIFWACILVLYLTSSRRYLREYSVIISILVFYLSTYLFFPVSARVFESGLILVLLAALDLNSSKRFLFVCLFLVYYLIQWFSRIGQPYFGWT